jgi:ABC-type multidrug transport system ATPase subunit
MVSSHILAELSKFASSYIFIDQGQIKEQISAAELDKRVGKILILKTSDNLHAMTLLKSRGFNAEIVKDTLNVHDVKEPADILNALQEEKIGLLGMKEEENSLEDYFVSLVGGNQK